MAVVAVIWRPCESLAFTTVDSCVMAVPFASVCTRRILNSAMYGSRARGAGLLIAVGLVWSVGAWHAIGIAKPTAVTSTNTLQMLPRITHPLRRLQRHTQSDAVQGITQAGFRK